MSVLVTVGTTKFDSLIQHVDKAEFHDQLLECGYTQLLIQYGSGEYIPNGREVRHSSNDVEYKSPLAVIVTPYLKEIVYSEYDLIIGHAGAGTILNSLRSDRKMIVVINKSLMNNHQAELATQLHNDKHLIAINNIDDLTEMIKVITSMTYLHNPPQNQANNLLYLTSFPKASNTRFKEEINKLAHGKNIWKN